MDQSLENRIRERAYEIWAADGYVHGQADQHWLAAEREILAASTVALVREPAAQKKRRSPARSKTSKALAPANPAHHTRKYVGANTVGPWVA
jgi:Protein of unknown function (DUF2934)